MLIFSYILSIVAIFFNFYALAVSYSCTLNKKLKFNFFNFCVMLFAALIMYLSNYYIKSVIKIFISFLVIFLEFKLIFKENNVFTIFKLFIIYLLLLVCDFFVSMIFLVVNIDSALDLGNINILKALCTILDSFLLLNVFSYRTITNSINKLVSYMASQFSKLVLVFACCLCFVMFILAYVNAYNFNLEMFLVVMILISFFLFLSVLLIFQYFKNKTALEEQKTLMNLMNEYEKILEKDSINRHEMLNNLIVLKSNKDKSSIEYENLLDEIIKEYQLKKSNFYTKLYKLPTGIKGIIYFKLANINDNNINFSLIISNDVKNYFEDCNAKLYYKICKILGILLDNAIEAAVLTDDKFILIDMYEEDNETVIYIENSFGGNIDLNVINEKGVSSKGKNRGYGLYIVNKFINESPYLNLEQSVNSLGNFVSILKIKNLI